MISSWAAASPAHRTPTTLTSAAAMMARREVLDWVPDGTTWVRGSSRMPFLRSPLARCGSVRPWQPWSDPGRAAARAVQAHFTPDCRRHIMPNPVIPREEKGAAGLRLQRGLDRIVAECAVVAIVCSGTEWRDRARPDPDPARRRAGA